MFVNFKMCAPRLAVLVARDDFLLPSSMTRELAVHLARIARDSVYENQMLGQEMLLQLQQLAAELGAAQSESGNVQIKVEVGGATSDVGDTKKTEL